MLVYWLVVYELRVSDQDMTSMFRELLGHVAGQLGEELSSGHDRGAVFELLCVDGWGHDCLDSVAECGGVDRFVVWHLHFNPVFVRDWLWWGRDMHLVVHLLLLLCVSVAVHVHLRVELRNLRGSSVDAL